MVWIDKKIVQTNKTSYTMFSSASDARNYHGEAHRAGNPFVAILVQKQGEHSVTHKFFPVGTTWEDVIKFFETEKDGPYIIDFIFQVYPKKTLKESHRMMEQQRVEVSRAKPFFKIEN